MRRDECPRLIYKNATLTDGNTGRKVSQLVCICLTDFEDLLIEPESEVQKSMKRMRLQRWASQLGVSQQELKDMIKY